MRRPTIGCLTCSRAPRDGWSTLDWSYTVQPRLRLMTRLVQPRLGNPQQGQLVAMRLLLTSPSAATLAPSSRELPSLGPNMLRADERAILEKPLWLLASGRGRVPHHFAAARPDWSKTCPASMSCASVASDPYRRAAGCCAKHPSSSLAPWSWCAQPEQEPLDPTMMLFFTLACQFWTLRFYYGWLARTFCCSATNVSCLTSHP